MDLQPRAYPHFGRNCEPLEKLYVESSGIFREVGLEQIHLPPMNKRTYNTLLGLGFNTDIIARIDEHGHTVRTLRNLSKKALSANYTESEIALIGKKIQRIPIPPEVVDSVLIASDRACCYCRDGLCNRPFQIHHAVEYFQTQDNSFENLILLCPNHHQTIPKRDTVETQKQTRAEWYALVSVVKAYRSKGISFPFGSFLALDYGSKPDPLALINGYRLSNSTALDLAKSSLAQSAVQRLEASSFLAVAGSSGSGKSTFARGIIGRIVAKGFRAFQFQPSQKGLAAAEILTFLSLADQNSILLLDDINVYLSEIDIASIEAASHSRTKVLCTWTREVARAPSLERHLPDWMLIDWDQLRSSACEYIVEHQTILAPAIGQRQGNVVRRVGLGYMDQTLESHAYIYAESAKSVSEFVFLLRGGDEIVQRELDILISADRSDIPIVTLAIEQIAGFESMLTPKEIVDRCAISNIALSPPISEEWVGQVLCEQVARGKSQESRGYFKTIHRDWASRLIDKALANPTSSNAVTRLLLREFNFDSETPERCMRLCSWLWYLGQGGKWVQDTLATKTGKDWQVMVGKAAARNLVTLGLVAERMHLLFQWHNWDSIVTTAFEQHETTIRELLQTATITSWPSLKSLSWTIETASPSLASRLWNSSQNNPKTVAALLEATHPDYYDTVSWYFGSVQKSSSAWLDDVGRALNVDRMFTQLDNASTGDISNVFTLFDILDRLHVPRKRSMIRKAAEAFGRTLKNCPLRSLHIGFRPSLDPTWLVFDKDIRIALSGIDPVFFSREIEKASPQEWRQYCNLTSLATPAIAEFEKKVIDAIDVEKFVANVAATAISHEYEFRCLLWALGRASSAVRKNLAKALYPTVAAACKCSSSECPRILEAFYPLDPVLATQLKSEFVTTTEPDDEAIWHKEQRLSKRDNEMRWKAAEQIAEKFASLEEAGEDYFFDPWHLDKV